MLEDDGIDIAELDKRLEIWTKEFKTDTVNSFQELEKRIEVLEQ